MPEDVGVVEVCAIVYSPTIDCPIAFPFDVGLSTSDGSAGNILVDGMCDRITSGKHQRIISKAVE